MTKDVVFLRAEATVGKALEQITEHTFSTHPVLNEQNHFLGLVSEPKIRRTLAEGGGEQKVGRLV